MTNPKCVAIIVTYEPVISTANKLIQSLLPQVSAIVLVDNGSAVALETMLDCAEDKRLECIICQQNLGIATAQNLGIERARALGAAYVALFDQDSMPPQNLIATLISVAEKKRAAGELIGAVGPYFTDKRLNKSAVFLRTNGWRSVRQKRREDDPVQIDHLIASGSLIPMPALDLVGGMRDELFIDYVDTEWSLRAEYCFGLLTYGTYQVGLVHELGEIPVQAFGRKFAIHSALRHYFLFRNSIWLWSQNWVPLNWKIARGPRLVLRLGFCLLFGRPIFDQWRMIGRGVWDGLTQRMGKFDG
jgi:rhamnosyltransferase